jgi:hypothetical protein
MVPSQTPCLRIDPDRNSMPAGAPTVGAPAASFLAKMSSMATPMIWPRPPTLALARWSYAALPSSTVYRQGSAWPSR